MTALGWLLIGLLLIVTGISLAFAWHYAAELDRVRGERAARARLRAAEDRLSVLLHAAPPLQRHSGRHQSRPATVPSALLTREQVTGHADAMFAASEPYLPPSPAGENPYPPYVPPERWQSYVNAGRAVEPVKADGHAPWTGEMPALTPEAEAAELDRQRYIKSHFAEPAAMTDAEMREAMRDAITSLRQPVYGEAPQDAVDEAQRLAEVMQQ